MPKLEWIISIAYWRLTAQDNRHIPRVAMEASETDVEMLGDHAKATMQTLKLALPYQVLRSFHFFGNETLLNLQKQVSVSVGKWNGTFWRTWYWKLAV